MNESLISIIMPVYNTEKYLKRCLNSIVNQTYKNWELVAVNDGSTDNSPEILKTYAEKDNRIIVLEQENQGQAVARNKALDIVKGEYLCFVDSDDWVELDFLEELYKSIVKTDSEVVMSNLYYSCDNKEKIALKINSNKIALKDYRSKIILDNIPNYLVNNIFKRKLFNNLRFKESKIFEDMYLFNDLIFQLSKDVVTINKPLYHYYLRLGSTVNNNSFKKQFSYFELIRYRYNLDYISKEEKTIFLKMILNSFTLFYQSDDYKKDMIDQCLNFVNQADKLLLVKAKKLLSVKEFFKFNLAYHCPIVFRIIYKLFLFFKNLIKSEKNLLNFYNTKEI